jgi:DNA polymerase-3 subunit delta
LSLYVGKGNPIGQDAVDAVVERSRVETVWALVDAISARRTKVAMEAVGSLLADREEPLRVLGMVSRQVKMVAKMKDALGDGLSVDEATRLAGAPPFKAQAMRDAAKKFERADLFRAFTLLSETDIALKGSKRSREVVLQEAVLKLCESRR